MSNKEDSQLSPPQCDDFSTRKCTKQNITKPGPNTKANTKRKKRLASTEPPKYYTTGEITAIED